MKKPLKDQLDRTGAARRAPRPSSAGAKPSPAAPGRHEADVTVVNKRGLHARAAAKFVKLAGDFEAEVRVTAAKGGLAGGAVVSGRSIMGLMMLAAGPGCVLHIEADGGDAPTALKALVALVEDGFEEED